jgi:hypothetical protein
MSGKRITNQATRKDESNESVKSKIILFMLKDKTKEVGLAEIHRSIETNYTKEGINGILKQLEKDGNVKNVSVKPKDPRYIVVYVEKFTAQFEAYAYKDFTSFMIQQLYVEKSELSKIKKYFTKPENDISEMIFKFGLISLQTILASYRRRNDPKNQEVWLRNAMSFENNLNSAKFSNQVKTKLLQNIQEDKRETNPLEVMPRMSRPTKTDYQKHAGEMELALTKMFPKMMKEFRGIEDNLWKKQTYETMKEVCKENPEYLLE